jgi:hypothetical protein
MRDAALRSAKNVGGSMRILLTLFKVVLGLAIAIPVAILALGLTVGILGAFVGVAFVALRLACFGFVGYGLYRLARFVFAPARKVAPRPVVELPAPDPYYEAAVRELDAELGGRSR